MNALDPAMFDALIEAGEALRNDAAVRAVVISGRGKAFCAGLDMASFERMQQGAGDGVLGGGAAGADLVTRTHGISNAAQHVAMVWRDVPVPVIAAVHGVAFGGGLQVALGADVRIVAPDTKMSVMEIKWGLVPDMAGMVLMRELARNDVVRELTFTGRIFSGEEALRSALPRGSRPTRWPRRWQMAHEIAQQEPRCDPRRQAPAQCGHVAERRGAADGGIGRAESTDRQREPGRSREGQHRAPRTAFRSTRLTRKPPLRCIVRAPKGSAASPFPNDLRILIAE
jgi:enoyl-CoA hydratase/carnithine racemase